MDFFHRTVLGGLGIFLLTFITSSTHAQRDFGVDVSHYQGSTGISQAAWNQMYNEGKRFVFIKATEGLTGPHDPAMANNVARATAAGLRVGVYHFAHPENRPTIGGAVQEADQFMSYAGAAIGPGFLRPVLDLEGQAANLSTAELTDWVIAFCNRVEEMRGTNATPIIYCNQFFANYELDSRMAGYSLWLRTITSSANLNTDDPPSQGYPTATGVFTNWSFWQYSATGTAGGISPIDLNVCHSQLKPLDSYLIPDTNPPTPPSITSTPGHKLVSVRDIAKFTVSASGTLPLSYQWRLNGTNITGATSTSYTRSNVQLADEGGYTVVVANAGGSVTSAVANLVVTAPVTLFEDDFDQHTTPVIVTAPGTSAGYQLLFGAQSGPADFNAAIGFNYANATHPIAIPPAPSSSGLTSKGLYLTVNKDATGVPAAVNLYPVGQSFTGNFALKFDMWLNWTNASTATEHALFGINHSGEVTNRIGQVTSDGLFYAVSGDGGITTTSTALRDYSVFQGGGAASIPILLLPGNTSFGPAPVLGPQFDNTNPGFASLFPAKTIPGFPGTPAGSAGLGWITTEVRQQDNLITWLMNDTIIAQYTNSSPFTAGNVLLGYGDYFASIGDPNNFVIFDNVRVESIVSDSDENGLPDAWEVQFFGQLGVDPHGDADGDNVSNAQEFFAGTNPTNAASALRMLGVVRTNNDVQLNWTTVGGRRYVVQSADSIDGEFVDVSAVITAVGTNEGTANFVHSGTAASGGGYYRVRVLP